MKKTPSITIWSIPNEKDWSLVACDIMPTLKPGSILALQGPLGAGKTTFVQALAKEFGAARVPKSPTFSMLRTYKVKHGSVRRLLHVDVYRIQHAADLIPLDLDTELADGDAILVLEWPENVQPWLKKHSHHTLNIRIKNNHREAALH